VSQWASGGEVSDRRPLPVPLGADAPPRSSADGNAGGSDVRRVLSEMLTDDGVNVYKLFKRCVLLRRGSSILCAARHRVPRQTPYIYVGHHSSETEEKTDQARNGIRPLPPPGARRRPPPPPRQAGNAGRLLCRGGLPLAAHVLRPLLLQASPLLLRHPHRRPPPTPWDEQASPTATQGRPAKMGAEARPKRYPEGDARRGDSWCATQSVYDFRPPPLSPLPRGRR